MLEKVLELFVDGSGKYSISRILPTVAFLLVLPFWFIGILSQFVGAIPDIPYERVEGYFEYATGGFLSGVLLYLGSKWKCRSGSQTSS